VLSLVFRVLACTTTTHIAVPKVQPEGAIRAQHTGGLTEYFNQGRDKGFGTFFQADLRIYTASPTSLTNGAEPFFGVVDGSLATTQGAIFYGRCG
jgi:hypothetical protein